VLALEIGRERIFAEIQAVQSWQLEQLGRQLGKLVLTEDKLAQVRPFLQPGGKVAELSEA
jgi:hypothetical protein